MAVWRLAETGADEVAPLVGAASVDEGCAREGRLPGWLPAAALGGIVAALGLAYALSPAFRAEIATLVAILGRGDSGALRDYILAYGIWAPVASLTIMVLQAIVPPIPSFFVIFANGLAFGALWGGALSVLGGTIAALVSFGIARSLGRGPVEALVGRAGLDAADGWFARWGGWTILLTRIIPGMPVDAISYAAGLTRMPTRRFLGSSLVGMLPQTLLYAYVGEHAPQYLWLMCAATVVVLGAGAGAAFVLRRRDSARG